MVEKYCPVIPDALEKKIRPIKTDFAITERTAFGVQAPDNFDYTIARDKEKFIEEYTTPEGEKRVRYTEKFLEHYDKVMKKRKEARKLLEKTTLRNLFKSANKFHKTHKTYKRSRNKKTSPEKNVLSETEIPAKEKFSEKLTEELWCFLEELDIKGQIKDITCVKRDNGGKKKRKSKPHFEVKIFLQDDNNYWYFNGTSDSIKEQLASELDDLVKTL